MTQYGVLALWEAWHNGLRVPPKAVAQVADWLLRTQDPSGGFGYQGKIAPSNKPIEQTEIRHSLTAAALGSLYMCADMAGADAQETDAEGALPSSVRNLTNAQPKKSRLRITIDRQRLRAVLERGNAWMKKNWTAEPDQWTFYYLYALERYMTFREAADGEGHGIAWYAEGAKHLLEEQRNDGVWRGRASDVPDTAFALLFLMRAMRSTVGESGLGAGLMVGGRGLPSATENIEIRGGRLVARPLPGSAAELMALFEDPDSADGQAIARIAALSPDAARRLFQDEQERLRRLLEHREPETRRLAVAAMAAREDLDAARWLIIALTDKDAEVVRTARDGLRRLARKPRGFGLGDQPSDGEKLLAAKRWRQWYRDIRPHVIFAE